MPEPEDTARGDAPAPANEEINHHNVIRDLKEALIKHPETAATQLGKYNIIIGQGSEIRIGDTINKSWDKESIEALMTAIQEANESTNGKVYQYLQSFPLETLGVSIEHVEKINSDLHLVSILEEQGYLDDAQKVAFLSLKKEVHSLNRLSKRLEELRYAARNLLEETRLSLVKKIQELEYKGSQLLDLEALASITEEHELKTRELELIEAFIAELEDTEKIATWINATRKKLAKNCGFQALQDFPDLRENNDSDKINYFCFSLYQFLEQISHCLKWGRHDILDDPEIPLVFDYPVYEKAFKLIKATIEKSLPSRFSEDGKALALECIDYLISQLPFYEVE